MVEVDCRCCRLQGSSVLERKFNTPKGIGVYSLKDEYEGEGFVAALSVLETRPAPREIFSKGCQHDILIAYL